MPNELAGKSHCQPSSDPAPVAVILHSRPRAAAGAVSGASCPRSNLAWRLAPRFPAILGGDRELSRANGGPLLAAAAWAVCVVAQGPDGHSAATQPHQWQLGQGEYRSTVHRVVYSVYTYLKRMPFVDGGWQLETSRTGRICGK